jgi:hypothetical protein
MTDLDGLAHLEGCVAKLTIFASPDFSQVEPLGVRDVSLDVHAAEVKSVAIGASHHSGATAQLEIGQDPVSRDTDRSETPRGRTQRILDLFI